MGSTGSGNEDERQGGRLRRGRILFKCAPLLSYIDENYEYALENTINTPLPVNLTSQVYFQTKPDWYICPFLFF